MKRKLTLYALLLAALTLNITSCSDRNGTNNTPNDESTSVSHFDIWTPVGDPSNMRNYNYVVHNVTDLMSGEIKAEQSGADLSRKLFPHTIIKGKYYYQISPDGRFGKYIVTPTSLQVVSEFPFPLLKERRYSHAWLDDSTLVLFGANGASDKVLWAKINVESMNVIAEGELKLPTPPEGQKYSTSGMAAYRKSDKMILYSFTYKKEKKGTEPKSEFYMAFVNPQDMSVKMVATETRAEMMASTAYGELRQSKSFFDENGDYYLACNTSFDNEVNGKGKVTSTAQHGALLRIKAGQYDFDKSYNGYNNQRGKIITANYLNNGKALLFMQDPKYAMPENPIWDNHTNPYVFYWIVVDLKSGEITELKDQIPFSNGNFSQLAIVVGQKVYIGNNSKDDKSRMYVYDIPTGEVTTGMELPEGLSFERIVPISA